jgi:hypothetical protein
MQVTQVVPDRWSFLIILCYELVVVVWLINIIYDTVINRLICFLVRQSEPSALELVFFRRWLTGVIEFPDAKHYNGSWVFDRSELDLNFSVIIYF